MSDTTATGIWFLDALGLGADADIGAIRRAYASRLKALDVDNDPAGFAQLREAFESARAFIDGRSSQPPGRSSRQAAQTQGDASVSRFTRWSLHVAASPGLGMATLLDEVLDELAHAGIDERMRFEDELIDSIASRRFNRWDEVIDVGERLGWDDRERLLRLDARGAWLAGLYAERTRWLALGDARLAYWHTAVNEAAAGLTEEAAERWYDVRDLFNAFPQVASMYMDVASQNAWRVRYEQRVEWRRAHEPAPRLVDDSDLTPAMRAFHFLRQPWMVIAIVCCLIMACVSAFAPAEKVRQQVSHYPPGTPAGVSQRHTTTPRHPRGDAAGGARLKAPGGPDE